MAYEISFNFNKKQISPKIVEFLEGKIVEGCEIDWLQTVFKGTILKKADANQLIRSLLSALEIHSPLEEDE